MKLSNKEKAYLHTLKILPILPKLPITPFHTKKIITLKKHTYKTQTFPLHTKKIITLKQHTYESENTWHKFLLIAFSNVKKSKLAKLKTPGTIFCSSLFQLLKKQTCKPENTWHNFLLIAFSNIKKSILTNLKIPGTIFCSSLFQVLKKDTDESEHTPFHTSNNNFKGNNLHKNHYIITILTKTITYKQFCNH